MIIFFNKETGRIIGTIEGRVHGKDHLAMWIGDREKTKRLVVQWECVGSELVREVLREVETGHGTDDFGNVWPIFEKKLVPTKKIRNKDGKLEFPTVKVFEPRCKTKVMKKLMMDIDSRKISLKDCVVDTATGIVRRSR